MRTSIIEIEKYQQKTIYKGDNMSKKKRKNNPSGADELNNIENNTEVNCEQTEIDPNKGAVVNINDECSDCVRSDPEHMFVDILNKIKEKMACVNVDVNVDECVDVESANGCMNAQDEETNVQANEKHNKKQRQKKPLSIGVILSIIVLVIALMYAVIYVIAINTDPVIPEIDTIEEEIFEYDAYVIEMNDNVLTPGKFMTCYDSFLISTIGTDKTIEMTLDKVQTGDVSDDEFVEDSRTIKIVPNETMEVIVDANDWYDVEFVFVENDNSGFTFNENAGFDISTFSQLAEKEMLNADDNNDGNASEKENESDVEQTTVPTIIIYAIESKHLTGGERIYMPVYTVAENTIFNPADYLIEHLYPTLVDELEKRVALKDDVMQRLFDYQGIPIKPKAQDEIFRNFIEIKDELRNLIGTTDAKEVGSDRWIIGVDHQWATTIMTLEVDKNLTVLDGTLEIDEKK